VIFIVEQGLSVFAIRYGTIFSFKHFGRTLAASFLKFIRFLIRLSRNVGVELSKSGNRSANGRSQPPYREHRFKIHREARPTSILPPTKRIELVTKVICASSASASSVGGTLLDHQVHGQTNETESGPNPPSASEQARHSVGVGRQPELGLRSDEG
jgi:hypothetical protein